MPDWTQSRWRRAESILERALELPPERRGAYLDEACAGDQALRSEVEDILAADAASHEFLAGAALDRLSGLSAATGAEGAADLALAPGSRFGPYRVIEEIGRGGMGVVALAERVDGQFEARVCLKLLKRGLDSEEVLRRFLQERQILAWLRHPNIGALLDGGIAADGRPYIVMEHIDGRPITDWCDERGLKIAARLELFRQVCRGVQHAHANLVVHRDLKPSNILVTSTGQVKLLDFGIAKILAGQDDPSVTRAEFRLFTPRYAAPEQVHGGAVTTATDVFALGVILYEVLTGHLPWPPDPGGIPHPPAPVRGEPTPPSAVAHSAPESRARGTTIQKLRRELAGDLDNIVLRALRAEPEARYPTAAALEEDLVRHLEGRPVRARPPAFSYRAGKFLRRHRVGVSAAMLFLLSCVGGAVGVLWQARETAREAKKTEAVKDFLTGVLEMASPSALRGQTITARQMLDRGAARVDSALSGQPEVQSEIQYILGKLYLAHGAYPEAERLLSRSLLLKRGLYGRGDARLIDAETKLATAHQYLGDLDDAEKLFREALEIARARLPRDGPAIALRLNDLAVFLHDRGEIAAAESLHREALDRKRRALGPDDPAVSSTLNNLATLAMERGDYTGASSLLEQALAIRRRAYGDTSIQVANTLHNLMVLSRRRGAYEEAEGHARETLAIRRRLLGEAHPEYASTLFNLGATLHAVGRITEAESAYREAIARTAAVVGADHADVAGMTASLARLERERGEHATAERLTRAALETARRHLPTGHPYIAGLSLELGENLCGQARAAEGEPFLRDALAMRLATYGVESMPVAEARSALGSCLAALGRHVEAEAEVSASLEVYRPAVGPDHERTRRAERALAEIRAAQSQAAAAAESDSL